MGRHGVSIHRRSRVSLSPDPSVLDASFVNAMTRPHDPEREGISLTTEGVGKPDKVARIAAARKLLLIAHAIYKSGESFRDPNQKEA